MEGHPRQSCSGKTHRLRVPSRVVRQDKQPTTPALPATLQSGRHRKGTFPVSQVKDFMSTMGSNAKADLAETTDNFKRTALHLAIK